jgi:hypothetical protein
MSVKGDPLLGISGKGTVNENSFIIVFIYRLFSRATGCTLTNCYKKQLNAGLGIETTYNKILDDNEAANKSNIAPNAGGQSKAHLLLS